MSNFKDAKGNILLKAQEHFHMILCDIANDKEASYMDVDEYNLGRFSWMNHINVDVGIHGPNKKSISEYLIREIPLIGDE